MAARLGANLAITLRLECQTLVGCLRLRRYGRRSGAAICSSNVTDDGNIEPCSEAGFRRTWFNAVSPGPF